MTKKQSRITIGKIQHAANHFFLIITLSYSMNFSFFLLTFQIMMIGFFFIILILNFTALEYESFIILLGISDFSKFVWYIGNHIIFIFDILTLASFNDKQYYFWQVIVWPLLNSSIPFRSYLYTFQVLGTKEGPFIYM